MKTKDLSLAEAHISGRKYRRAGEYFYYRLDHDYVLLSNALAIDYELEPEAKLLTREEVRRAVLDTLLPHENTSHVTAFHRTAEICYKLFGEEDV